MSLNSFFTDPQPIKQSAPKKLQKPSNKPRKTRSDKRHNVKFPVNQAEHMQLKTACKQVSVWYKVHKKKELTQTAFNTYLLNFALDHIEIVNWNKPYKDSKRYMHTQALESDYQRIGGPYGLAIEKGLSERRVVYYLVISALEWLRRKENYVEIFQ
jgi:hypothetical protein